MKGYIAAFLVLFILGASSRAEAGNKKISCSQIIQRIQWGVTIVGTAGLMGLMATSPNWYLRWENFTAARAEKAKILSLHSSLSSTSNAVLESFNAAVQLRTGKDLNTPLPDSLFQKGTPAEWAYLFSKESEKYLKLYIPVQTNTSIRFNAKFDATPISDPLDIIRSLDLLAEAADNLADKNNWASVSPDVQLFFSINLQALGEISGAFAPRIKALSLSPEATRDDAQRSAILIRPPAPLRGIEDSIRKAKFQKLMKKIEALKVSVDACLPAKN